jgi:cell wall-associated NlpC family hydrolase
MTVVTVWSSTVGLSARPAGAETVSGAKAKAAQIESQLTAAQNEMSLLSQRYDAAAYQLHTIQTNISTTEASIANDRSQVASDRKNLSAAAVATYVTDGSAASQNPIFSNTKTVGAANEYAKIATGDINLAMANLHTAENALGLQELHLQSQRQSAQAQVNVEQTAINANAAQVAAQKSALAQENGEVASLIAQQQAAQAAQAKRNAVASLSQATIHTAGLSVAAPPPTAPGGAGAVQAAESQIGVPYRWGAESPKGSSDPGFDCSGLTAFAWGEVGVGLPHYSGAQMADSAPVPLSDLQPGDLLFYGPGGDEHVAMYIGGGQMIEAPYTGASVWITGARFGGGFVGAGRP